MSTTFRGPDVVSVNAKTPVTVSGLDVLVGVAAFALYRWIKDYFDYRRKLNETEILKQQERVVAALIRDGFKPREAKAVTFALLERIAQRTSMILF